MLGSTGHFTFLELRFRHAARRPSGTTCAFVRWHVTLLEAEFGTDTVAAAKAAGVRAGEVFLGFGQAQSAGLGVHLLSGPTQRAGDRFSWTVRVELAQNRDLDVAPWAALHANPRIWRPVGAV